MSGVLRYLSSMFGGSGVFIDNTAVFYFKEYGITLLAAVLCSTPLFKLLAERVSSKGESAARAVTVGSYAISGMLFIVCVSFLVIGAYNPFIYFNF